MASYSLRRAERKTFKKNTKRKERQYEAKKERRRIFSSVAAQTWLQIASFVFYSFVHSTGSLRGEEGGDNERGWGRGDGKKDGKMRGEKREKMDRKMSGEIKSEEEGRERTRWGRRKGRKWRVK